MSRILTRAAVLMTAVTTMIGFGYAGTAQAANPATSKVAQHSELAAVPYIYGYYRLWADCDIVGFSGLMQGRWRSYGCDSRYIQGYFALVIYG